MKTKILILLIALLPILFISCEKNEVIEENTTTESDIDLKSGGEFCGEPLTFVFKNVPSGEEFGTGFIGNDETHLYVNFDSPAGWTIDKAVIYAGSAEDLESLGGGDENFLFDDGTGYFNQGTWPEPIVIYSNFTLVGEFVYQYDTLPQPQPGECFVVVLAANFKDADGNIKGGYALASSLKSSGYYMDYCIQECPPPEIECETAFAYGDQYAYCFRGFKKSNGKYRPNAPANKRFKRWGWTNGKLCYGTYDFPLWAGAGQCDLSKGTLVGNVVIEYSGCNATVTYNTLPGYVLDETHLYIGGRKIPRKSNGKPTVAPGKYPYKHEGLGGVSTDTYIVFGVYGQKNIIAHAVVCPEE